MTCAWRGVCDARIKAQVWDNLQAQLRLEGCVWAKIKTQVWRRCDLHFKRGWGGQACHHCNMVRLLLKET